MVGSLTPRNQSGEEKNSADASDSFSSFIRINFILFGGTQREGKAKAKSNTECNRLTIYCIRFIKTSLDG